MAERIDLNTADRDTLAQLPGIGDVLAERIIDYRENVHPFEEVIELAAVTGVSERMVRQIEEQLTVSPIAAVEETGAPLVVEAPLPEEPEPEETAAEPSEAEEPAAVAAPTPPRPEEVHEPEVEEEPEAEPGEAEEAAEEETIIAPEAEAVARPAAEAPGISAARIVFVSLAGAFMGAALTLLFLFLLNGTLLFGGRQQLRTLQQEVEVQGREQESPSTEVDGAAGAVATMAGVQETLAAAQSSTAQEVRELEADVVPAVATLDAQNAIQATRVSRVADAAANFETFLDSLRDLLVGLRGLPPTATPTATATATATPTAAAETATPGGTAATETPRAGGTPTPAATRTRRPTATPIVAPTRTPGNSQ